MNSFRSPLTAALLVAAVAAPAAAQCSSGPFIAAPLALSTADDPLSPFDGGELYHKDVGFHATAPSTWSPLRGVADFRLLPAFRSCGASPPFPDVDAFSTGEDWILADDTTGRILMPQNRWGGLTVSVTPSTVGAPGSVIRAESSSPEGAAGDVFSWILPGSVMPAPLVATTERAHDGREIDLGGNNRDVDALDVPLPMWRLETGIRNAMLNPPKVFFSFSRATLPRVPATWWAGTSRSGATIFQMIWSPRTGRWSCPRIWKTYADLGLGVGEDVDALSVDERNQRILFSTTTRSRDPLLFLYCGTDLPNPVTYSDQQGQPVSGQIGLIIDDDIDAICAVDPSVRGNATGLNAFGFSMGTPVAKLGLFGPADVASSAFRTYSAAGAGWQTWASGWPPGTGRAPGFAVLLLSIPNGPPGLLPVTVVARNPADPTCGAPATAGIPVPNVLSLTGSQVDLHWFVTDQAVTSIGEAYPIRVRL